MSDATQPKTTPEEELTLTLFRLFKLSTMHDLANQAVERSIEHGEKQLQLFFRDSDDEAVVILFAGTNVFVNGQPLRASRATYETIQELGYQLDSIGFNELRLGQTTSTHDIYEMLTYFVKTKGTKSSVPSVELTGNVRLQYVDPSFLLGEDEEVVRGNETIARPYTSSLVILRRMHESVQTSEYDLAHILKRIAQTIVMYAEKDPTALLKAMIPRPNSTDRAAIALHSAIIAATMTRIVTRDPIQLLNVAYAGLLLETAATRISAENADDDPFAMLADDGLSDEEIARVPSSGALVNVLMTGLFNRSVERVQLLYEALWLSQPGSSFRPYDGKLNPSMAAIILATSYKFQRARAFDMNKSTSTPLDDVIEELTRTKRFKAELLCIKLLCSCLGIFPRASAIELTSGWRGVVVRNHEHTSLFERPHVLLLQDPKGNQRERLVDLGALDADTLRFGKVLRPLHEPDEHIRRGQRLVRSGAVQISAAHEPDYLEASLGELARPDLYSANAGLERLSQVSEARIKGMMRTPKHKDHPAIGDSLFDE